MKQRLTIFTLIIICVFNVFFAFTGCGANENNITADNTYYDVWDGTIATSFKAGDGSTKNPYQISTGAELAYFASLISEGNKDYNSANYCLLNSIDLNGMEWTPIGFYEVKWIANRHKTTYNPFYGSFDGKACIIRNFKITKASSVRLGFFSCLDNATVKNLGIIGSLKSSTSATEEYYVGSIAGLNIDGTIEGCFVYGDTGFTTTTGDCYVGGIVGYNTGIIVNSFVLGDVDASYQAFTNKFGLSNNKPATAGGIVAYNAGKIENCFIKGNISAFSSNNVSTAGGIVGYNEKDAAIYNVYVRGSVISQAYDSLAFLQNKNVSTTSIAGGIAGTLYGIIENSYSNADVEAMAISQISIGRLFGTCASAKTLNVYYVVERNFEHDNPLYSKNANKNLCDYGSGFTENVVKTADFITGLGWNPSIWHIADNNDPYLIGLPNSFTVFFSELNTRETFLDLDGYRDLNGYEAKTYTKSGYNFEGWIDEKTGEVVSDSNGKINVEFLLDSDTILIPKLSAITYYAEFYADDVLIATVEFTIEDTINEPKVPEKLGYIGSWEQYDIQADNLIIKAIYVPIEDY